NATVNAAGTLSYTPAAGTILGAGGRTLTVSFTPADPLYYSGATKSVTLVVQKATPVVIWPAPGPIAQGTALSGAQLDASANVGGTFSYAPPAGTVLPAGLATLSVTFTPTDANFATVSKTVSILLSSDDIARFDIGGAVGREVVVRIGTDEDGAGGVEVAR